MVNDLDGLRRARLGVDGVRSVRCYGCGREFEVPIRARSVCCPECHQQLNTLDITVRAMHWGTSLRTTGSVMIHRKAHVVCSRVIASGDVRIDGAVEADVDSGGVVVLGPLARLKGSIRARKLVVDPGAEVDGGMACMPRGMEMNEMGPSPAS